MEADPDAHGEQDEAPRLENVPALQLVQTAVVEAPINGDHVPALQAVQEVAEATDQDPALHV